MTAHSNRDHRIAGTVKFDASVLQEKLRDFIEQMKSSNPECWVDLHVRGAGNDGTHYIAFHYILPDGKKKTYKKAVNRLLQYLCDRLGEKEHCQKPGKMIPRGVMGWSISPVDAVA